MEADQRGWISEARGVESMQQLDDANGFVRTEAITAGFELGELAIESVWGHGWIPNKGTSYRADPALPRG